MERNPNERQDTVKYLTLTDYPREMQKKITLLQHFRSYLEGEKAGAVSNTDPTAPTQPSNAL
jgi:polo-like kinase 1